MVVAASLLLAAGTATIILSNGRETMQSIQSGWSVIRGDGGQWIFGRDKIEAHSTTGETILASNEKYGDVTFSAVAGSSDLAASLAIRLQDARNGYFIVFAPAYTRVHPNAYVLLAKRVAGRQTTLAVYEKQKLLTVGYSARIKVVAKGPVIQVFLNGAKVLGAEDTTFTTGNLGLRISGFSSSYPCDATFSDVKFY